MSETLLKKAVMKGSAAMVEFLLLEMKADVMQLDSAQQTLLVNAILGSVNIEVIKVLLEYSDRVAIDQKAAGDFTALMRAVQLAFTDKSSEKSGYAKEVIKLLLEKGASISAKNRRGKIAFELVPDDNKNDFIDLILNHFDKEYFKKNDGNDVNHIKDLAKFAKEKGDLERYYRLEILVEKLLEKFPFACLEFDIPEETRVMLLGAKEGVEDVIPSIKNQLEYEIIIIESEIEELQVKDSHSPDLLLAAEGSAGVEDSGDGLEDPSLQSLKEELIGRKNLRLIKLKEEVERVDLEEEKLASKVKTKESIRWDSAVVDKFAKDAAAGAGRGRGFSDEEEDAMSEIEEEGSPVKSPKPKGGGILKKGDRTPRTPSTPRA